MGLWDQIFSKHDPLVCKFISARGSGIKFRFDKFWELTALTSYLFEDTLEDKGAFIAIVRSHNAANEYKFIYCVHI